MKMVLSGRSKRFFIGFLFLIFIVGAVDGTLAVHHHESGAWTIFSTILISATIFAWYYFDSHERAFRRSALLNVAVVALAVLAVPYYLIRSRESGKRLGAFLCFLGAVILAIAIYGAGNSLVTLFA
jgi:drug/metabolite transporter (DMT)-like permease